MLAPRQDSACARASSRENAWMTGIVPILIIGLPQVADKHQTTSGGTAKIEQNPVCMQSVCCDDCDMWQENKSCNPWREDEYRTAPIMAPLRE